MRLQILSDLHLEMMDPPYSWRIPETAADVVVLAGDIGVGVKGVRWAMREMDRLNRTAVYVPGNHEYYGEQMGVLEKMKMGARGSRVHVLDMEEVVVERVRFLGATLWTDYLAFGRTMRPEAMDKAARLLNDHHSINQPYGFMPRDALERHERARAWLEAKLAVEWNGPTVVVTHHAPSLLGTDARFRKDYLTAVLRRKVLKEGQSIRRVARELGLSRNTVAKYLDQPEPARRSQHQRERPVWEVVKPRLEELVAEWEPRTTGKQRITAMRLHRQLRTEGYRVGRTLVGDYWRERRRQRAEVYVPLINRPGEAQIDFFEVVVEVGGERRKAWEFLMRLMYSGREFAWLYERCDQLAFLDGHVRAFAHLGGVARRCVYDNLAAAVRKIVGARRELTGRFLALVSHYLFEPDFARIGEGHDKGGVESRGKAIRLEHLTPIPRGDSLEVISHQLLGELDAAFATRHDAGRSASELWAEERVQLLPVPATSFEVRKAVPLEISSRSMVRIEGAWYSVPSRWARLNATAYLGVDDVRITCMGESVTHPRARFGTRQVRYRHYLPELSRKPHAVRQVAPELIAELGAPWSGLWGLLCGTHGELEAARVVARLLGAVCEHGEDRVRLALEAAINQHRSEVADIATPGPTIDNVAVPDALAAYVVEAGRASDYDHLLADGAAHE